MRARGLTLIALLTLGTVSAETQELELSFADGRVTLVARDVPLGDILEEWSDSGDTRFVDAERLPVTPLRLLLVDVAEDDALRILLRELPGYVAAPRSNRLDGQSRFDRVIVMNTSPGASRARRQPAPAVPSATDALSRMQRARELGALGNGVDRRGSAGLTERDALGALRDLLPSPDALDPAVDDDDYDEPPSDIGGLGGAITAPRPGMVIASEEEEEDVPAFIRPRPVTPQEDDP